MPAETSTTAAKASGITPTTALPDSSENKSSARKPNLPASNPLPLPESPPVTFGSGYPAAAPASGPAAPTASITAMAPTDQLMSLDDDTTPTKTTSVSQTTTNNPPAPQPGAFPTPVSHTQSSSSKEPFEPRPGAVPSVATETPPIATMTSIPAPTFTVPPPIQTTYGPPEVTLRGQPIHGTVPTATATSIEYKSYPSAIRRGSDAAPLPGSYQQRENLGRRVNWDEEGQREPGILGKLGKAVDKVNEWMVGDKGSSV